jgi:hypothetical protein
MKVLQETITDVKTVLLFIFWEEDIKYCNRQLTGKVSEFFGYCDSLYTINITQCYNGIGESL